MKMKTNIIISIVLAAVVTLFFATKKKKDDAIVLLPRSTKLTDMQGKIFDNNTLKDKVVIMSYFQTWCSDCAKEQPELLKLKQKFGDQIEIMMISDEPVELMLKYKEKFQSPLNYYHSAIRLRPDLGIKHFPTTYLINKKGEIKEAKVMSIDWYTPETIAMIEQLLAQ